MSESYDYLIIGSGAGGAAAAYRLGQSGARVLLLEKGEPLPRDGSTLDPTQVLRRGASTRALRRCWTWRNTDASMCIRHCCQSTEVCRRSRPQFSLVTILRVLLS